MKISKQFVMLSAAGVIAFAGGMARGDILTQWNFNFGNDANTATGSLTPNIGAGTASLVGGTTATFASGDASGGSTDPNVGDDSAWNTTTYAAQGAESGLRGAQFAGSTAGFQNIIVSFDQRHSNSSSRFVQFQYSTDGISFSSAGLAGDGIFSANAVDGGDLWYNGRTVDLSGIAAANDNANFAFRVVAIFEPNTTAYSGTENPYAGTGTLRLDMVTINGTAIPAPGALALLGLAGLVGSPRRRK